MSANYIFFEGTAREAVEKKLQLNNAELDLVTIGLLAKHGIIRTIGDGPKPQRGKTPKKYAFIYRDTMVYSYG